MPSVPGMRRLPAAAMVVLPAAATVYLAFQSGGFFAGATSIAACALLLVAVLRVTLAEHPFEGYGPAFVAVLLPLSLFAVWTLASSLWSTADARAVLEFNRALLYVAAFGVMATFTPTRAQLTWAVRVLFFAIAGICLAGLATRLLPDVFPTAAHVQPGRLSFPVYYWNALGLMATVGSTLGVYVATDEGQPLAMRAVGSALIPGLAVVVLLTFSRGAIAAVVISVVAYVLIARPRGLPTALLSVAVPVGVALVAAYGATELGSAHPTSAAAVAQGRDLLKVVIGASLAAGVLRLLLGLLDSRVAALCNRVPRRLGVGLAVGAAATALVVATALGAPAALGRQYDRFVQSKAVNGGTTERTRLTNVGNNGRLDHWRVAVKAFEARPTLGHGAGTYQLLWAQYRRYPFAANDGHSLYIEVLGELGVVGLALVVLAVVAILITFARSARGRDRYLFAALFAVGLAWALHAGIDWDWEVPAVTLWFFAFGGLATAALRRGHLRGPPPSTAVRTGLALALLLLAVLPALTALSQHRLDDGLRAFKRGDCPSAIHSALGVTSLLSIRPEPFEILGYCDGALGLNRLGVSAMESAVRRDPEDWELVYGLALARARAGLDPRPEARRAVKLNPLGSLPRDLARRVDTGRAGSWSSRVRSAPLPEHLRAR